MTENDKKPEVRFIKFTDVWEQRKLGEIYTERKERGYDSLQILSVSIHHGVSSEELDSSTLGKKVRRSEDKSLYKHVYFGDLVLNMMRAWQGAIGVVKSEGMVSPAYITAIPSAQLYPLFMDYCLRRDEMITQMNNLSYGVTDFRKRLYWDSFINVLCRIPSVPEQERITAFFTHLDNLITLHQRKYDKLIIVKKSMLEKLFPKVGSNVPEIRFTGFTDAWEQRKVGDIGDFRSNGVDKRVSKDDIPVSLLNYMDVYNRIKITNKNTNTLMQVTATAKQIETNNIEANDIFFTPSSETADDIGRVMVVEETLVNTVYSYHLVRFRPHQNVFYSIFPNYVFETPFFRQQLPIVAQGVQRLVLNRDAFENLLVTMPELKEQKLISEFFKNLDNLITLHQRELEKLKNIKKAMLDNMFV